MTNFSALTKNLIRAMEIPDLKIPISGIKFYKNNETVPDAVKSLQPDNFTITSCHAIRCATLDDDVYLTEDSIGCIAAAISLGLVEKKKPEPLEGDRVYTEFMRKSSGKGADFIPPSPRDFSNGSVYACQDSGHIDFGLFGKKDSGRFKKKDIAIQAIARMHSIQPPIMQGIFYFSSDFDMVDLIPDIVIMSLRPVELCRVIQGYQFLTGERVRADVGGLRAGCSDLIVRPYIYNEINFSPYCLGARLIAKFEANRMGIGMPYALYELMVQGVDESKSGFPFPKYPGADE